MGVESGTYVNDFDATLPTATDLRSQGDDHIRLLKTILKNTFTGATRAFQIPGVLSKSANYTVVKADGESTVYCTTAGGAVTFTLPTLVALDVGWKIHFIKTNSGANPMFIAPPSGTINSGGISGLAQARRAIPGVRITVIWDGSAFFVTRAFSLPIGALIDHSLAALPAGFEWPNGQTLASVSTNYPEFNSVNGSGVVLDLRGRYAATLDNLGGSAASRITTAGGGLDGATLGTGGGVQSISLAANQIPSLTSINAAQAISVSVPGSQAVPVTVGGTPTSISTAPGVSTGSLPFPYNTSGGGTWGNLTSMSASNSISVAYTNASLQTVKNLPPTIMLSKILVVE